MESRPLATQWSAAPLPLTDIEVAHQLLPRCGIIDLINQPRAEMQGFSGVAALLAAFTVGYYIKHAMV